MTAKPAATSNFTGPALVLVAVVCAGLAATLFTERDAPTSTAATHAGPGYPDRPPRATAVSDNAPLSGKVGEQRALPAAWAQYAAPSSGRPDAGSGPGPRRPAMQDAPLEARLHDPDPEIRIDAIQRAYGLDPQIAIALLQGVIVTEKDGFVAAEAAAVLQDIGGEAAVAAVTSALGDGDAGRRSESIEAIGRVGEPTVHLLGQVLFSDPDPELRLRAVELLAGIESPAAIALLTAAARDSDPGVSDTARDMLQSADHDPDAPVAPPDHWLATEPPADDGYTAAILNELSARREPTERVAAIQRLYTLDDDTAIGVLHQLLQRDADVLVREEALFALEQYVGPAAERAIETALGDGSPTLRQQALQAIWLSDHPDRQSIASQVLYTDPDPAVRREAVRLLGEDAGPASRLLLDVARSDGDAAVRQAADAWLAK